MHLALAPILQIVSSALISSSPPWLISEQIRLDSEEASAEGLKPAS